MLWDKPRIAQKGVLEYLAKDPSNRIRIHKAEAETREKNHAPRCGGEEMGGASEEVSFGCYLRHSGCPPLFINDGGAYHERVATGPFCRPTIWAACATRAVGGIDKYGIRLGDGFVEVFACKVGNGSWFNRDGRIPNDSAPAPFFPTPMGTAGRTGSRSRLMRKYKVTFTTPKWQPSRMALSIRRRREGQKRLQG